MKGKFRSRVSCLTKEVYIGKRSMKTSKSGWLWFDLEWVSKKINIDLHRNFSSDYKMKHRFIVKTDILNMGNKGLLCSLHDLILPSDPSSTTLLPQVSLLLISAESPLHASTCQ